MSDPVTNTEIEDVLSSIRRLVAKDRGRRSPAADAPENGGKFVLTPAHRVAEPEERADSRDARSGAEDSPPGDAPTVSETASETGHAWASHAAVAVDSTSAPSAPRESEAFDEALERRIAELEAAINQAAGDWEPDGSEEPDENDAAQPLFRGAGRADGPVEGAGVPRFSPVQDCGPLEDGAGEGDDVASFFRSGPSRPAAAEIGDAMSDAEEAEGVASPGGDGGPVRGDAGGDAAGAGAETAAGDDEALAPEEGAPDSSAVHGAPDAEARRGKTDMGSAGVSARQGGDDAGEDEAEGGEPASWFEAVAASRGAMTLEDDAVIDEETLRRMVAQIVREELQGVLGERITRNIRRLVRREIQRAFSLRDAGL
ncbi:hypothetical protein SAMN05216257_102402 [Meinhardsimonia xiamenensis]|jgi:cell pole-organizing protein PopZ|uniref:Uncharacterized protein n=1 Tax=Meinhardsimonia xiamenensis TaxID=990712 RepID=A0A1G9B6H2_9RHOB|nr:hypothetical protein [Meinhardsimonia xiamenensis]PRX35123.1 hypothetical protein LV81_01717 [Meinhardsimonia xiamenensis]SDK34475.1 hypothetical protein SAMN05216257_102402 [Meinhardsimonia xiamenensis]